MATIGQKRIDRARPLVFVTLDTGCYVPISHKLNADGYFRKNWGNRRSNDAHAEMFHRAIYRMHNGEIPAGYEVDHMCRVRACCNPDHLQLLTRSDHAAKTNTERSGMTYRGRYACKEVSYAL